MLIVFEHAVGWKGNEDIGGKILIKPQNSFSRCGCTPVESLTHIDPHDVPRRVFERVLSFLFSAPLPSVPVAASYVSTNIARSNIVYYYISIIETTIVRINHVPEEKRLNVSWMRFPIKSN